MTAPIGISWEGAPYRFDDGDDPDALPSRIHASRYPEIDEIFFDGRPIDQFPDAIIRRRERPRPSLWQRLKSWAENLLADPEGDDE